MVLTDLVLDVDKMTFDRHGVRGFVWPLARAEVVAMRDATSPALVAAARASSTSDAGPELLSIVFGAFLLETMRVYQANAINRRLATQYYRASGSQSRLLSALGTGGPLPPSPTLDILRRGLPQAKSRLRRTLGRTRTHLSWNGLSAGLLRRFDPEQDVAANQRIPLIHCHARSVPEFVRHVDMATWFGPLDDRLAGDTIGAVEGMHVIDKALGAARGGFAAGNEELSSDVENYLRRWLTQAMGLSLCRLTALLDKPDELPRHLWTGAGGGVWNRILRHATLRLGGRVTGHDHGTGSSHLVSSFRTLFDFESCNTFVTFTETGARALREGLRRDLLIPAAPPDIVALAAPHDRGSIRRNREKRKGAAAHVNDTAPPMKRVMYPCSFYMGDGANLNVPIPDIVALDWEARLFSHLREWGYEVLHKPHPGSVALPPAGFANGFGGLMLTEPFEKVMHLADGFIFVSPQTSIIIPLLESGKPAVFIDAGLYEWTPEAYALLRRRCPIVRGRFDDANRLQVDWDEVRAAFREAPYLTDTAIVENYWAFAC